MEVLAIGEHGHGLAPEKLAVPNADEGEDVGEVLARRGGAKVLIHVVEARKQFTEAIGSNRNHGREPDGGVHRIATADPIPESEHVRGVDAELGDLFRVG